MVQGLIDETYNQFKSVVQAGRAQAHQKNGSEGQPLADNWQDFADGRVLSGSQALKLGFVDQLGDFDDAVKRAKAIANIHDGANLIEYREHYDLSNFLSLLGQSGKAHDIKLDLGMDIPKLQAGALYFLWQAPGNYQMQGVTVIPHPLVQHNLTRLRDRRTQRRNSAACSRKSRR